MLRFIQNVLLVLLTSFFVFPFEFTYLPGVNTKMIMAAIGIFLLLYQQAKYRMFVIDYGIIRIFIWALLVSFFGILSVIYNETRDYAYASYIVSMLVWLFGAYTVVYCIKLTYGKIDIPLISNFIIACAVFQCITAIMIEYIPAFSTWVDKTVLGVGFQKSFSDVKNERLYGIGAFLDVAGMRFSCILGIIAIIVANLKGNKSNWITALYITCFIIISCIGNMMSRTTIIGTCVALIYWLYCLLNNNKQSYKVIKYLAIVLAISLPLVIYFYHSNDTFYNKFRFGFEGFFNYFEAGEWRTQSNDKLQNMFVLPDNLKTWLIGDGYFEDVLKNPYYIGHNWLYFYMGTDVGYSRFLFYFGILGLGAFCGFFIQCATYLMKAFPAYKSLFLFILAINFIVWIKVSSDCFTLFALYLAATFLYPTDMRKLELEI